MLRFLDQLIHDENRVSTSTMGDSIITSQNERSTTSFGSRESTLSSKSSLDQSVRSARAAKVFGDLVTQIDGTHENSLSYSPSPFPKKQGLTNITNMSNNSPCRVLPFGSIQFTTVKKLDKGKQDGEKKEHEGKENEPTSTKVQKPENDEESVSTQKSTKLKKAMSNVLKQRKVKNQKSVKIENKDSRKMKNLPKKRKPIQSTKHVRYSSTHQVQASKAQHAIKLATESVNQSLNASRAAKMDHLNHVAAEVARLREEWKEDKEEAAKFYSEMQQTKREMLDVRNKLSSQYAQNKVDHERNQLQDRLAELDKEIKFKSDVYVAHKKKLKDNEEKRRRMSVSIKAKHRNVKRANTEALRLESIQEQHELFEHKWAGERDAEEYKKKCEQERRDSYAFRNAEGRRQRNEQAERKALEQIAESKRLEHKWAGERDAEDYKKQCAQERRESYAFRNAEGRRQRLEEEERNEVEKVKEHESYEHKWAGERDAEEYKKKCEQERRESFAFRGRECVRRRAVMEELQALAKEKEHESYVLKWAAQDDAKAYLAEVAEERRKSFAFRNLEGRRHRQIDEENRCEELQKAHELEDLRSACKLVPMISSFKCCFLSLLISHNVVRIRLKRSKRC